MCFRPADASFEMKCPKCGATVDMFDEVCPECGATADDVAAVPSAPAAPQR